MVFIASSGSTEQSPREQNTHEGTRAFVGGNSLASAADPGSEQRPEVDATTAGASGQPLAGRRRQRREGTGLDERYRLTRGRKPLKREPWTRQRDETSPQGARRSKPSRVCETPRAERRWARERPSVRGLRVLTSRRGRETPRKVLGRESGRATTRRTLKESEAHERMNPASHEDGGCWRAEDHLGPSETARQ